MKKIRWVALVIICMMIFTIPVSATVPYSSYNYDRWEDVVPAPAAYLPTDSLSGKTLGVGYFNQPSDMVVSADNEIYILDTNNNRIVIFDEDWNLVEEITTFDNNGTEDSFNLPSGIFVTDAGVIYVADSENRRVVALGPDRVVEQIIENPQSETFEDDFEFVPQKVGVDYAGRIYVIARGVFEGIMSFDETGKFYGYVGTINVAISPIDILWRALSTKAQREKQQLYIPTEFTGLDLDPDGFVYTTNVDSSSNETIKRLNPSGNDVLKRPSNGQVKGDLMFRLYGQYSGASRFEDLVIRDKGIYTAIDSNRGRVFSYDHEGNLLYVFGSLGSQLGTFKKPVAVEVLGDQILILDQEKGHVVLFNPSEYGTYINTAVGLRYDGDEEQAVYYWQEVLKRNVNFELAYVGIGKSLLAKGDNKAAMKYLKLGMDQKYYSVAYKRFRNEVLKANLGYILTGLILLVIVLPIIGKFRNLNRRRKDTHAYDA